MAMKGGEPKNESSLADKIKLQIKTKMRAGLYEIELLQALPLKKLEVLENLIQE